MKEISRRQNESKPLKIQFTSRMLFNRAERENYFVWVLYVISALMSLLNNDFPKWVTPLAIIVFDLLALALEQKMKKDIIQAANLRSLFDRYVFGMPQVITREDSDELYEIVEDMVKRHPEKYRIQITHTGSDTPPGVKNWYNTNIDISTHTVPAFYLIKENKWWDKKMVRSKNVAYIVLALIVIIPTAFFGHCMPLSDIIVVLAGILGLLIRLGSKIITMCRYQKISNQLDGFVKEYDNFVSDKGLNVLQNTIEERRRLPLVHCNAIHTRLSKKLNNKYDTIYTDQID